MWKITLPLVDIFVGVSHDFVYTRPRHPSLTFPLIDVLFGGNCVSHFGYDLYITSLIANPFIIVSLTGFLSCSLSLYLSPKLHNVVFWYVLLWPPFFHVIALLLLFLCVCVFFVIQQNLRCEISERWKINSGLEGRTDGWLVG